MKGILIVLAGTFVLFFGGDIGGGGGHSGGGGGGSSVLEVGDQNFTVHEVGREFNDAVTQISARTGQRFDTQTAINIGILDQTIARMASQALFDQAAQELGVTASIAAASDAIRNLPQFQDTTGRFNRANFEASLAHQGLNETEFVNQVRVDLLRSQYIGTIQNAVRMPSTLSDTIYSRRAERRVADIATVPLGDVTAIANPSGAELAEFFTENKDGFQTPQFRTASLATLEIDALVDSIVIPDEEIAEEYEARLNDFQIPETRNVVQASLLSREDADRALQLIRDGKNLAEAAEEVSGLPPVDLGQVRRSGIALAELASAAFSLAADTVSDPVESVLGWHLVEVSNIVPSRTTPLSEAGPSIREELAREQSVDRIFDVLNDVEDGLAGGATLENIARDSNLKVTKVEDVARNGQTLSNIALDNPAMTPDAMTRLFGIEEVGLAEVIENRTGGFSVLRLDSIDEPRVPELSEIRDLAIEVWKGEQLLVSAEETAGKITDRANAGENLETLANEFGAKFERSAAFDRTGEGATVALPLVGAIFDAELDEIVEQSFSEGVAVSKLIDIQTASQSDPAREELAATLSGQLANDLVTQLSLALQEEFPVDIDSAALREAFTPQ